jgi:hypothetical protein
MTSSNSQNHDAATSALLKLIESYERLSQWTYDDVQNRFLRISELCARLLKELDGVPPGFRWLVCEPESSVAIRNLMGMLPAGRTQLPAHRPSGFTNYRLASLITDLFRVEKKHGGRLTLTKNIRSVTASGSLPAALEIFHRFAPSIVPASPSYSTLNRMRRASRDKLKIPKPKREHGSRRQA